METCAEVIQWAKKYKAEVEVDGCSANGYDVVVTITIKRPYSNLKDVIEAHALLYNEFRTKTFGFYTDSNKSAQIGVRLVCK